MRVTLIVLSVLLFSSFVFAQTGHPVDAPTVSFAGKWVLDKNRSDSGVSGTVTFADSTMVVTHDTREIVMVSTTTMDSHQYTTKTVYSLDGSAKGTVKIDGGAKVVATWDGKKLVHNTKSVMAAVSGGDNSPVMQTTEEWTLAKDGKTLIQTLTRKGLPAMPNMKSKFVYTRVRN